ncbi:Catenin-beta-like protein [Cyathus striatus]|nr:Catenin-beta-like protein [Cyathus striatus]
MDIDKLFKVPKLPIGGTKRKSSDNPTPEMLKKMRIDENSDISYSGPLSSEGSSNGKARVATVEEVDDQDSTRSDFAPGGDADYFAEEDDEGRFYGGGLTSEQKEILNIFDRAVGESTQDEPEELSITTVRQMLLRFERAVNKNTDQRSKYPNEPTRFIDSEADLDSVIKSLLPLSQVPTLAYPEIVRSGTVTLLIGLLTHENVDIVIDVVELIHELTDEDVGNDVDEEDREDADGALKVLIEGFLENSILELLVDNLGRMNEAEDSDRQGVFHVLGIFENILAFNPDLSAQLVKQTKFLSWILQRVSSKDHDENRSYAAELLSILLQNNAENRIEFGKQDGVEVMLKVISQYRRKDPIDADESEFMENIFDSLCSSLSEASVKQLFLDAEGTDLMVLLMKEKMQSKSRSVKTLDYAMSGPSGSATCEAFVEALGLKTLFSTFMGKPSKKQKNNTSTSGSEDISHILGIIASLFSNLSSDSPARIRLLAKFVEANFEKVDKLLDIRESARLRLKTTDIQIKSEMTQNKDMANDDDDADSRYLKRLDGGLFTLQMVDYILAWIIMEDDGIRFHVLQMLNRKNQGLLDIVDTLKLYYDNVGDGTEDIEGSSQKDILGGLISALDLPPTV